MPESVVEMNPGSFVHPDHSQKKSKPIIPEPILRGGAEEQRKKQIFPLP